MDMSSDFGSVVIFDKEMQRKARVKNLQRTVYNVGTGVEESFKNKKMKPWLFSLTYRDVNGWKPEHITIFLNRVRAHLARRQFKLTYVWVAELQKRGALHYHVIIWLPSGFRLPKVGRSGWWPHGFTDQKMAEKGVGYLMKYISKDETKHKYPKGVRIYGYGGVDVFVRRKVRFFRASSAIRRQVSDSGLTYKDVDIRRVPGGKCDILSGWFFPTFWKCVILKGVPVFFRVFEEENEGAMLVDISERIDYYIDVKEI